jgi:hypothetical protein
MTHVLKVIQFGALLAGIGLLAAVAHAAADVSDARIVQLRVDDNATATLTFDRDGAGRPACATYDGSNGRSLTLDLATNQGRETLKLATTAYLAGKMTRFVGSGLCTIHPNKENLKTLYVY